MDQDECERFSQSRLSADLVRLHWTGCDWETEFGLKRLNLCGLSSHQARLAANATRGEEAECWRQAARWLERVEADASTAMTMLGRAADAVDRGQLCSARSFLVRAADLEARYPRRGEILALLQRFERLRAAGRVAES